MIDMMDDYDYCICFIELPSNRALAERLVSEVASYRLPKNVQKLERVESYQRAYLMGIPSDGLLTPEQESLLKRCRWLLIFCTGQAREAQNIRQVIQFFMANKGRAFILPILLEGEPQNAFPPEFFEERISIITFFDGTTQSVKEIIEPLAVDMRAKDHKTSLSLIHHARIKVVAALIGASFDTLEQRHEKRMRRRVQLLAAIVLAVPIILGTFFTYLWINSEHQIDRATQKAQISKDLLADMCENYPTLFKDIPEALPLVNGLLLDSLEKLRVADSSYITLLPVDNLIHSDESDDMEQARKKAKILRYLDRKDEAVEAYREVSLKMEQGGEEFRAASRPFAKKVPASLYPCGIWVRSISDETSRACDGLLSGDIIVSAKGFKFRSFVQFQYHVYSYLPQDKATEIIVLRLEGESLKELTLDIKPEDLKFESEEL